MPKKTVARRVQSKRNRSKRNRSKRNKIGGNYIWKRITSGLAGEYESDFKSEVIEQIDINRYSSLPDLNKSTLENVKKTNDKLKGKKVSIKIKKNDKNENVEGEVFLADNRVGKKMAVIVVKKGEDKPEYYEGPIVEVDTKLGFFDSFFQPKN
jgi:hypothetical protein